MKILSLILLLMVSTNVFAEWTVVGSDGDGATSYADFGTIKRKGSKVKMWILYDYKTVQKGASYRFLSVMQRDEYDCEEEIKRMLDLYWYSGNMRGGDIVYSYTNMKMEAEPVLPGSIDKTFFKIACGKK